MPLMPNACRPSREGHPSSATRERAARATAQRTARGAMLRITTMAALAAAIVSTGAIAQSGRLSLAERVERLEQQAGSGAADAQSNMQLLERINALQQELSALRNTIEQQGYEIETLKRQNRDQYVDLDSRISRIEGGAPVGAAPATAPGTDPALDGVVSDAATQGDTGRTSPGQLSMEPPEVRGPVDAGTSTTGMAIEDTTAPDVIVDPEAERRAYESAFDSLKEGRYAEAARRFQSFLAEFPNGEYAPNAQYWLGESYYVTQNYQIALDAFQTLLTRFPNSSKAPDALLKVGYCHYELRQWSQAEAVLNQVIDQYPDTTVARLAQGRLRALRLESRG